jgi:hypothetical protein
METSPNYHYYYADLAQTLTVRWRYNLQSLFLRSLEPLVTTKELIFSYASVFMMGCTGYLRD